MNRDIITSAIGIIVLTLLCGIVYPLVHHRHQPGGLPRQRQRPAGLRRRQARRLEADRPAVRRPVIGKNGKPKSTSNGNPVTEPDPRYFQTRPSGTVAAGQRRRDDVRQLRPEQHDHASRRSRPTSRPTWRQLQHERRTRSQLYDPAADERRARSRSTRSTRSASGVDPDISVGQRRHPGPPDRRRPPPVAGDGRRADLASTPAAAASGSPANPASTCWSSTSRSNRISPTS